MEEERIQKFKDLILNEHYCEDCNELCAIGKTFPLEFIAKYIIRLEKRIKSKEKIVNAQQEHIKNLEIYIKELGGEI